MSGKGGFGGCLAQVLAIGLIIAIAGIVELCNNSQLSMIKDARKRNNIGYYKNYLDKYPTGRFADEAYGAIVMLWDEIDFKGFQEIPINAGDDWYYKAAILKYEQLYSAYTNADFRAKLREKMEVKCRNQYDIAKQLNTLDGWTHYLTHVPDGFEFDAQEQFNVLHDNVWGTEESAWEYACGRNMIADYEEYESLYPKGKHVKEAESRVVSLYVDNVFRNEHGSLPAMSQTSSKGGSSSTVTVENATSYVLTVYYNGADGKRLIVSPRGTQSVVLANGFYRIAASVDDSRVIPFAGTENLTGGNYDVRYYITTTRY